MFILHIALQGCVRARDVPYGITPDTGGHIKYLLELVAAADRLSDVTRQEIVVRRFDDPGLGACYASRGERLSRKSRIVRIDGDDLDYRSKEEMVGEMDALDASLAAYLRGLDRLPDVIHAHYADAGLLALHMKRRFGVPYVFTAHSLGRVKRATDRSLAADPVLARRIAVEDEVVAGASRIVASSRNEKERQYGLYQDVDPRAITVNPPGCDLSCFGAAAATATNKADAAVADAVTPFLRHPERPAVLALARPVHKKNLAGLVRAFGTVPGLAQRANLVIFAGSRGALEDLDGEGRAVVSELLALVDRYDLWGRAALPKRHEPGDVAAIYRFAAARGGVFVNPAFNEPFGLTLLEAAASGVPVVATRSGGPADIVGRLRNGALVDPCDDAAIGGAVLDLLNDRGAWRAAAANGRRAVAFYDWDRHAAAYLADLRRVVGLSPGVRDLPVSAGADGRRAISPVAAPPAATDAIRLEAGLAGVRPVSRRA